MTAEIFHHIFLSEHLFPGFYSELKGPISGFNSQHLKPDCYAPQPICRPFKGFIAHNISAVSRGDNLYIYKSIPAKPRLGQSALWFTVFCDNESYLFQAAMLKWEERRREIVYPVLKDRLCIFLSLSITNGTVVFLTRANINGGLWREAEQGVITDPLSLKAP